MGKWDREQKIKEDPRQTVFVAGVAQKKPAKPDAAADLEPFALCPFCMFGGTLDKFVISVKNGFHRGLGQCPRCKNRSEWQTLRRRWKVREFAKWCFDYARDGFWSKVSYQHFNEGLRARGVLDAFWLRYRELKGPDDEGD